MAAKKKRSAKQIAATKRLVAFNKKRRGKKRVAKKARRKRNPNSEYVIFRCGQNGVSYLSVNSQWVGKASKGKFISNSLPFIKRIAQHFADQFKRDKVGVAAKNATSKEIIASCSRGKK